MSPHLGVYAPFERYVSGTRNNLTVCGSLNVVNYNQQDLSAEATRELLVGSLKLQSFPDQRIPSLYCGSVFESDMCINSASAIYNGLWSYGDTRYKTAV
jgi:hypothetical protein